MQIDRSAARVHSQIVWLNIPNWATLPKLPKRNFPRGRRNAYSTKNHKIWNSRYPIHNPYDRYQSDFRTLNSLRSLRNTL